ELVQGEPVTFDMRSEKRSLVVVAQQVLIIGGGVGRERLLQKTLRQDYLGSVVRAERAGIAAADAIEAVARRNHPGVVRRAFQVLSKVLEDGWVFRRSRGEVIESFINSSRETGGSHVVPQNSAILHARKECALRQ